jgi:arylsulfatase A-like enzyme
MQTASQWLRENAGAHERFLLFIDEFDPHEPFDTPAPWADRYDPDWTGDRIIWPPYSVDTVASGTLTAREAQHIRANYGAKLSMIDHWFGRLLDTVDALGLRENTAIIVCTDHGHYLGERDIFGKPGVPLYEPLGHTPLMVYLPGAEAGTCNALTTNVDINATLYDLFGIEPRIRTHGRSLLPLLRGESRSIRDWALAGVYGRWVHVIDGERKYARAPVDASNLPLAMWSNRWSTMPVPSMPRLRLPKPDRRAVIDFMPGSDIPVLKQAFTKGDRLPWWCVGQPANAHVLYDLTRDPGEQENLVGGAEERRMIELLHAALTAMEAPREQFERLGIA